MRPTVVWRSAKSAPRHLTFLIFGYNRTAKVVIFFQLSNFFEDIKFKYTPRSSPRYAANMRQRYCNGCTEGVEEFGKMLKKNMGARSVRPYFA